MLNEDVVSAGGGGKLAKVSKIDCVVISCLGILVRKKGVNCIVHFNYKQ